MGNKKSIKVRQATSRPSAVRNKIAMTEQDFNAEGVYREKNKFDNMSSSNRLAKILIPLILIAVLVFGAYWFLNKDMVSDGNNESETTLTQKTGVQIERQIRDIIYIPDDEEVVTLSYINTADALQTLKAGQNNLLEVAEVGDYYVVFTNRAILYRDGVDKIMNYAPIVRN